MRVLRSLPRPLRWLAAAALAYAVVLAIGLVATFVHYSTTPKFEEYVRSHAVTDGRAGTLRAEGEVLSAGRVFSVGDVDPGSIEGDDGEHRRLAQEIAVDLRHGDTPLLRLDVEIALAARRDAWVRDGVSISVRSLRTHEAMRAIVAFDVDGLDRLVGPESEGRGSVELDVLLLSGAGPSVVEFLDAERLPPMEGDEPSVGFLSPALFGFFHPLGGPPDEGLIHRVRHRLLLRWTKHEGGGGGPGHGPVLTESNSREYSLAVELTSKTLDGDFAWSERTTRRSRRYSWNGEVW